MGLPGRIIRALPLLLLSPFLLLSSILALAIADLVWLLGPRKRLAPDTAPSRRAVSIVIPTWDGRDLLERHLPSVSTAAGFHPENEIIVVDNASSDGTPDFVRSRFPHVKVLPMPRNLGFGGAANAGVQAARNDIVVLLNNDMRVEPGFIQPLLDGFTDAQVFAVSCQVFFSDPNRRREETGLTQGRWDSGFLRVRHRVDEGVRVPFPCFYGGGGSCAFDRSKFLELGGFDPLFEPFYLEDTDLGYMGWKRGWKVLYQPASAVYHEHRGTIGRRFTQPQIASILAKNFVLWSWKNIHEWRRLGAHFFFLFSGALVSVLVGESSERAALGGLWQAWRQLPGAIRSRRRARDLSAVSDTEAFRRPMGGYFRDRFTAAPAEPARLRVLFVSPYPIVPPVHGGAVFMYQTLRELVKLSEVHLIALLEDPKQVAEHRELAKMCATAEFLVRSPARPAAAASCAPHAVREFASEELDWLIHRQMLTQQIDVVQFEYAPMGQYAGQYHRVAGALFEHDIYFQSIARGWKQLAGPAARLKAGFEYLRALHYETRLLPRVDSVQTCSRENSRYLLTYLPALEGKIRDDLRAGIDTARYCYRLDGREPDTVLFLGSFRHLPNLAALDWFLRLVLPRVVARRPSCRLIVVGSDPPPAHVLARSPNVELRGFVEDVREPLSRYALFVSPILSGSGIRVKLLEAFASGIPVVSTRIGAEGLVTDGDGFCALADEPAGFAGEIVALLEDPDRATAMAARAREAVVSRWDMANMTARLEQSYRDLVRRKRTATEDRKR